jgi:hypothetical protein
MDGQTLARQLNGFGFGALDAIDQFVLKHAASGNFEYYPIYRTEDDSLFSNSSGQRTLQDALEYGDEPVAILCWLHSNLMALRWLDKSTSHAKQTFAICKTTHPLRLRGGYTLVEISRTPSEDRADNSDGMVEAYAVIENGELVQREAA